MEAIEFFKHLNTVVQGRNHGVAMIAEESTAWPKVTDHPENDGLGFTFKWNMGWMHDFLEYMKLDPYFRKYNHNRMTFSLTYFTSENYILVLSHDEVVHLKCSMINKMPGLGEDKFSNLKAGYTFMLGHPGKKLLFMGQDFGQWHEWDEKVSLDWYLAEEESHKSFRNMSVIFFIFIRNILVCTSLTTTGTASSGSMQMTGTAAFSALSARMRQEKKPAVCSKLHTSGSPGLPCRCTETVQAVTPSG